MSRKSFLKLSGLFALAVALLAVFLPVAARADVSSINSPGNSPGTSPGTTMSRKRLRDLKTVAVAPPVDNWEIRTAPIMYLFEWTTIDVSYRINSNWSTGPSAVFYHNEGGMIGNGQGQAWGWQAVAALKSLDQDSLYLSGHAYWQSYSSRGEGDSNGHRDHNGVKANTDFGYRFIGRHFVVMTGAGLEYIDENQQYVYDNHLASGRSTSTSPEVYANMVPHLEFKVGARF